MRRCSKCILPETIPNITFDVDGVCHYCRNFEKVQGQFNLKFEKNQKWFINLINEKKEKRLKCGGKYDVLVPLSGGRDSSYIAYKLATQYNLKVLCVNYANPFSSKQAIENMENLVKTINTDLIRFNYSNCIHERTFKTNLMAWLKKPSLATLGLICIACKPIYFNIFKIAHKNKIELIVEGANIFEVATFKMEAQTGGETDKLLSIKPIVRMLKNVAKNLRYVRVCNFIPAVKTLLTLFGRTPYLSLRYPNIIKTGFFYIFPYDEQEITETLKKIGWKKAEDNNSPWRFDCEVDSVKNYIYKKMIGATEKDDLFSKNIRANLMSREEALERIENEGDVNPKIVERVLNKVGLKKSDLDNYLERKI